VEWACEMGAWNSGFAGFGEFDGGGGSFRYEVLL
jgi:hypothetical protein